MMDSVAEEEIGMEAGEVAVVVVVVVVVVAVDDSTRTEGARHQTEHCRSRRGRKS